MNDEIEAALEAGAGYEAAKHPYLEAEKPASPRKVEAFRRALLRFLDEVPEHMTVNDLRREIEP